MSSDFKPVFISLVRRPVTKISAYDICGIQMRLSDFINVKPFNENKKPRTTLESLKNEP